MIAKSQEKYNAIRLRKQGLSYSEIGDKVSVSKATLSLWLHDIKLNTRQKKRLANKQLAGVQKGGDARRQERIERTEKIKQEARNNIGAISKRELWLIGMMLYWGEGSKEREGRTGSITELGNSDPQMLKIFLKWLTEICGVKKDDLRFDLYIHKNSKNRLSDVKRYWSHSLDFPIKFCYIHLKKHNPKTKRKNTGNAYYGLVRVRVLKSTDLNRKIAGWIEGVYNNCGVV